MGRKWPFVLSTLVACSGNLELIVEDMSPVSGGSPLGGQDGMQGDEIGEASGYEV